MQDAPRGDAIPARIPPARRRVPRPAAREELPGTGEEATRVSFWADDAPGEAPGVLIIDATLDEEP